MEFRTETARRRFADLTADTSKSVICLDFDGTLAPIVEDPQEARIHPEAAEVLVEVAAHVRAVAVVTGRPVRQAVALGDLDAVGAEIDARGGEFLVLGQYGNERWSARDGRVISPRPPRGLATLSAELPDLLRRAGLGEAHVESKGLSVAVHTRRMPDPAEAVARLEPLLRRQAARHDLVVEPGRMVVEVRAPGMDKGNAVRALRKELRADAMMFVGDDLGDVEAFEAVRDLRRGGMVGFLVCSGSEEQTALVELSDAVVDGPDGVLRLLRMIATAVAPGG